MVLVPFQTRGSSKFVKNMDNASRIRRIFFATISTIYQKLKHNLRLDANGLKTEGMGVRPTHLTIKQPAFQKFRPDYGLFQNLHDC